MSSEKSRQMDRGYVPYYVLGLALGVPAILLGIEISGWISIFPAILHGHSDFRQLYTAAYMIRTGHGHQLYDYASQKAFQNSLVGPEQIALPFLRPASQALLFLPLSLMPYRAAFFTFLIVNLGLLALSYRFLRPHMNNLAGIYPWLPAAMFLTFIPVAAALMQGQDSLELLVLIAAGYASLLRRREMTAGALVGFGIFKFQIVLPVALIFLLWRRWRFLVGFALSTVGISLVSIWVVGLEAISSFALSLIAMSAGMKQLVGAGEGVPLRYATYSNKMPNLRGLIFNLADPHLSAGWIQALVITLSVAIVLWVTKKIPRHRNSADLLSVAIITGTTVCYYLFMHDMAVLLVPLALTIERFILAEVKGDREDRVIGLISMAMFVAPVWMAIIPSKFYLVSVPLLAFLFVSARKLGACDEFNPNARQVCEGISHPSRAANQGSPSSF